jgi:soluble lytic murein transglycosylase-like protein
MKINNLFNLLYVILCILVISIFVIDNKFTNSFESSKTSQKIENPPSFQLYEAIEKYSEIYKVPKNIAYNVAYRETGYKGPFHWSYNPYQKSNANAVGPMQIITKYSHYYAGRKVSEKELKTNIDLNVEISMKILSSLYKKFGSWALACGYYNTGYPTVNDYASYCYNNKNYVKNWSL